LAQFCKKLNIICGSLKCWIVFCEIIISRLLFRKNCCFAIAISQK
jgi:hypothetical protein